MPQNLNLKHQISIFANLANNQTKEDWQEQIITYSHVEQINEKSITSNNNNLGHLVIASYFVFTIRYIKNINTKMRVVFENDKFIIEKIINVKYENRFLQLITKQI